MSRLAGVLARQPVAQVEEEGVAGGEEQRLGPEGDGERGVRQAQPVRKETGEPGAPGQGEGRIGDQEPADEQVEVGAREREVRQPDQGPEQEQLGEEDDGGAHHGGPATAGAESSGTRTVTSVSSDRRGSSWTVPVLKSPSPLGATWSTSPIRSPAGRRRPGRR